MPTAAAADGSTWTVRRGEVLSVLAHRFNVTVEDLQRWNQLPSDRVLAGQELCVEAPCETPELELESNSNSRPATSNNLTNTELSSEPELDSNSNSEQDLSSTESEPELDSNSDLSRSSRTARQNSLRSGLESESNSSSYSNPRSQARPARARFDGVTHEVRRGDTLSQIATQHDVRLAVLIEQNPHLDPERLTPGEIVHIAEEQGRRIEYPVPRGATLSGLARRFRVTTRDLRRWNPSLRHGLQAGRTLIIWSEVPPSTSQSIGRTNRGRLIHPEQLPRHSGYVIRDRARAFGTLETILWTQDAFDAVAREHNRSPRLRVHDISNERGGWMRGHRSHQSGRDVDLSYYQRRCPGGVCPMRRVRPRELDVARQWTLMRHWLVNNRVEAIFMDYRLMEALYQEARRRGATRSQLARWFQCHHGRGSRHGLIRHFAKHADHLHVRFVCPDTDERCR